MKQKLLMDFLQVSETLKLGKKHHKKKDRNSTNHRCHLEDGQDLHEGDRHHHDEKRKRKHKMSFPTRITLLLLLKQGSLNQRTIAKSMNISSQAVSEIIKKLLEIKLINKERGEINNENIITLTDEGKVVAEKIDRKINTLSERIFKDFTEEEIETFGYLLNKIQNNKDELFNDEDNTEET